MKINKFFSGEMEGDAEFFPVITEQFDDELLSLEIPNELPVLALRNMVLFPGIIMPVSIGRQKSLALIREAYKEKLLIGVSSQKDIKEDDPSFQDLYAIGTVARVVKLLEMPDGGTTAILQGFRRFSLVAAMQEEPYMRCEIKPLTDEVFDNDLPEVQALMSSIRNLTLQIIQAESRIPNEIGFALKNIESSTFLVNFICSNLHFKVADKQELLAQNTLSERGFQLLQLLSKEVELLEIKNDIESKVKTGIDQQQREYLLQQQIKTIQDELGGSPQDQEVMELKALAKTKLWSAEVAALFEKEMSKLERLNPMASDYSVQSNYIRTILDLPWNKYSDEDFKLKNAEKILNADHFGLEKVKERILEYLAVLKLKGDMKSPIICLLGPPGVGKTSLGKSIARSLNRQYVRISLGGVHDESEIRGHRRTYIGAMPGRIIQSIKKAGVSNPLFVLDEIDKLKNDYRGDAQAALLEVLDPEQNNAFHDNFLDIDYDLSKVMFVATANSMSSISQPLRDRMEVIDIVGYVMEEKVEIARRHLIPKLKEEHGLLDYKLEFSIPALKKIITNYTRESGVRGLEKALARVMRKVARKIAMEETYEEKVTPDALFDYLGVETNNYDHYEGNSYPGVVTGLAWTAVGGDILYVESDISKGTGKLSITGNLGEVMKESTTLALEYIKSHTAALNLDDNLLDQWNIHVHVPEGAIPKDGPSAGITMVTAMVSALSRRKVKKNLAMTGEITLRGKVLPVGGIQEKLLAAKRSGIKEVILCKENEKNVNEIKAEYLKGLSFHFVEDIQEVIQIALLK